MLAAQINKECDEKYVVNSIQAVSERKRKGKKRERKRAKSCDTSHESDSDHSHEQGRDRYRDRGEESSRDEYSLAEESGKFLCFVACHLFLS